jgi:hypothetical protein
MERCFASNNKFWDFAQVRKLLRWRLLHDALVVVGVDGWLDDCRNIFSIRACRRFVSDCEVSKAKGKGWVIPKRRPERKRWPRRLELDNALDEFWAHIADPPA